MSSERGDRRPSGTRIASERRATTAPSTARAPRRVPAAHRRGLRLVYERFHARAGWPVIGEIDHEEFNRTGRALSITALLVGVPHVWSSHEGLPDGRVWITLRGIRAAIDPRAEEIVDTLRIVAHCVGAYRKDRKAKLHRADVLALGLSEDRAARFHLLMLYESSLFGNGSGDATTDWEMEIKPTIAYFADLETIDDLFATQKRVGLVERSIHQRRYPGQIVPLRDDGTPELNMDVLANTIDPELWEHVGDLVRMQKWTQIASQTTIFLESTLRSWLAPTSEPYLALAAKAFHPDKGRFVLGTDASERDGWFRFAHGIGAALRNVDAHRIQRRENAPAYAMGVLGAASLLLSQTKQCYPDLVVLKRVPRRRRVS